MPLPSTRVIPAGWSRHHQAAAAGGMNAKVTAGSLDGEPHYDPATDETTSSWTQDYVGPARIQALTQAEQQDVAGQQISGRPYLVQLDARQPGADLMRAGKRVRVLECANDAALVKQVLWVVDVQMGSERFTRDLVCSDNQADTPQEA